MEFIDWNKNNIKKLFFSFITSKDLHRFGFSIKPIPTFCGTYGRSLPPPSPLPPATQITPIFFPGTSTSFLQFSLAKLFFGGFPEFWINGLIGFLTPFFKTILQSYIFWKSIYGSLFHFFSSSQRVAVILLVLFLNNFF